MNIVEIDTRVDSYDYSGRVSRDTIEAADQIEEQSMDIEDISIIYDSWIINDFREKFTFRNAQGDILDL